MASLSDFVGGVPALNYQEFTSSTTWTVPADVTQVRYTVVGAGGGAGGGGGAGLDGGNSVFDVVTALGGKGSLEQGDNGGGADSPNGLVAGNGGQGGVGNDGSSPNATGGEIKTGVKSVSPGSSLTVTIGAGGTTNSSFEIGGEGGDGIVILEWLA